MFVTHVSNKEYLRDTVEKDYKLAGCSVPELWKRKGPMRPIEQLDGPLWACNASPVVKVCANGLFLNVKWCEYKIKGCSCNSR